MVSRLFAPKAHREPASFLPRSARQNGPIFAKRLDELATLGSFHVGKDTKERKERVAKKHPNKSEVGVMRLRWHMLRRYAVARAQAPGGRKRKPNTTRGGRRDEVVVADVAPLRGGAGASARWQETKAKYNTGKSEVGGMRWWWQMLRRYAVARAQ